MLAQIGACALLALLVIISATATVSAPQMTLATATPSHQSSPSRTPSPRATATSTRALVTPTSAARRIVQSVPGQPQVDANTVALYHFDAPNSVAIDATGNYTGTLHGNATILDSGLYAGVLRLDGNGSYVRTGYLGSLPQGTIELFVDFQEMCQQNWNFTILAAGGEFGSNSSVLVIGQFPDTLLRFGIYSGGQWHWADSGINACRYLAGASGPQWPYETWRFHHVAATWGPRGMEIWVDGVLHGVGVYPPEPGNMYNYRCNPQMQLGLEPWGPPNPLYPVCKTPVMAPTMTVYPPGDYTGDLPDYSTMLIGCNPDGSCFKGRIDEVRISNVQRTFHWSVVPTVTPTPTWTPIAPSGEYSVDLYTRRLYHLNFANGNGVWDEVNQTYTSVWGRTSIVPNGRFNAALSLDDTAQINLGDLGPLPNGTVEAWVNYTASETAQPLFAAPRDPGNNMLLFLGSSTTFSTLRFGVFDGQATYWVDSGVTPASLAGCWHHVAGTWGARGLEIWIDGTLRKADPSFTGTMPWINSFWRLGYDNASNYMKGIVDEVRVSTIQRTFVTPPLMSRVNQPSAHRGDWLVFLPLIYAAPTPISRCPFGP